MGKPSIIVTHPNGYTGALYGESSLSVYKDGKELIHTGFRNKSLQTAEDLYIYLESLEYLVKELEKVFDDIYNDEEADGI